ncbi:TBC1 domain family member 15 [Grus japonensis]|uniref:TBC1 domain family member 15 n=1 Tax=Grus japonensis TaxID=30415 RepID=A0ABC9VUA9_GRUJA
MAAPPSGKVVYEQEGVFIHSSCGKNDDQDSLISGVLRVIEKENEVIVDWRPLDDTLDTSNILCAGKDSSSVVEWTQTPKDKCSRGADRPSSYEAEWDMITTVSFKKKPHSNGDATTHANGESKWSFLFSLTDLKSIKQNKEGMGWSYLVFCLKDDVKLPALHFHHGDSKLLIKCLEKHVVLNESPQDKRILLVNSQNKSLSQSFENLFDEPSYGLLQKLKKDPYTVTMGRFSKVTNYIFDSFRLSDPSSQRRPPSEMADFLNDAIPGLKINQQEEPGFEVITRGLCHTLRKEAWKFLLGYFPWNSTKEERANLQKRKTDEYFRMKLQWKSVSEEQEKRNSRLRDYRSLIEKDVNRTDRTNKFYEGEDNPGLILLHDILMTYCMYDFDLGYVQGMSDLLSPVLYVMENEVDAFWCFVSYMDQMHINELSMKIDVEYILCKAEAISMQMMNCRKDNLSTSNLMFSVLKKNEELPQAVSEILGIESSSVTPDSDTGEDESGAVLSCPKSSYESISTPVIAANGTRDSSQQMSETRSLTPA